LAPQLLKHFHDAALHENATQALVAFGDPVVGLLSDRLGDPGAPAEERKEIPDVLAGIGTPAAAQALLENVMEGDATLRFMVISALNRLHRDRPEIPLDFQLLETVLAEEILGHYHTYQILEAISTPGSPEDVARGALQSSLEQELERIFRLLGLLYPQMDLKAVYLGLQSKDKAVHDNSLEFLENVFKSALRTTHMPLLDGQVTPKERARLANQFVRTKLESRDRHTFATRNLQDHVCDIKTLQNWMGHKDLASTMVYLKAVRNKDVMARVNASELAGSFLNPGGCEKVALPPVAKIVVGLVQPVFPRRVEDIEIDSVFERPGFVRHVRWDAEDFPGVHDDFFAVDRELQRAFQDVRHLLVVMMVEWDVSALLHDHARQHDLVADHHFAVDQRIEMFALDFVPRDVLAGCGCTHLMAP
jgi:hypothetical protein